MDLVDSSLVEHIDCKPVSNQEAKELLESTTIFDMVNIIKEYDGLGLAAPQVGIYKRFFVVLKKESFAVFFNPVLIKVNDGKKIEGEGCLNYDGGEKYTDIRRFKTVDLLFDMWDESQKRLVRKRERFHGVDARVIQHEVDHLNGKTIFMR